MNRKIALGPPDSSILPDRRRFLPRYFGCKFERQPRARRLAFDRSRVVSVACDVRCLGNERRRRPGASRRLGHWRAGVKSPVTGMKRANLISLLEDFRKFGPDAAVVERQGYRRKSRTYAELWSAAEGWSARLADREISPGDRVILWGANSAQWVAAFWGVLLRGAVPVPMDGGARREFVEDTIRESGAKLVLRDR